MGSSPFASTKLQLSRFQPKISIIALKPFFISGCRSFADLGLDALCFAKLQSLQHQKQCS